MSTVRIVAAAIRKNPRVYKKNGVTYTEGGVVFTGTRHGFIIRDMVITGFLQDMKNDYVRQDEQGFIDSLGHFWNREVSREIAIGSGQITSEHGTLYSEDLW